MGLCATDFVQDRQIQQWEGCDNFDENDFEECVQEFIGGMCWFLDTAITLTLETTFVLVDLLRAIGLLVLYGVLAVIWEWAKNSKWVADRSIPTDLPPRVGPKDKMVIAEEERVANSDGKDDIIRVENLRRVWKTKKTLVHAVRGVSWSADRGQVLGLLGTNGAGKTTTFKMMSGITQPSAGKVTICGLDMAKDKAQGRRMIGYTPQFDALWPKLTVIETLYIYAKLRGYVDQDLHTVVERQIVGMQLEEYRHRWCGSLSGGTIFVLVMNLK